ncbi:Gfo/Idh/MocA family protein [Rhodopirellula halodulae]|uniref:Gfo/Idh/MocA family protein n=1 Tax=Rhodopirellula halodulae TaxID=2894198 RepID=UPI001E516936|nr:Gfo/Idh/MocA family oxidoreductase [Rhodopirellula sp. JC737]MCC9658603.1 Gfo/Idh/MocA family oxidoreductase [Rhodopirellula sp. JC737]
MPRIRPHTEPMAMTKRWRIAGINFSHMHMGDLLRQVSEHPDADLVGVCDHNRDSMQPTIDALGLAEDIVFTDEQACLTQTQPDFVVLCPPTGEHAEWVERVAPFDCHVLVEKPFAATLADADRMIEAMRVTGKQLMINWPSRWQASHYNTWKLIQDGLIGDVLEVHHYGGNRGPLYHGADKVEFEPTPEQKQNSWWYKLDAGGGSLRDYLGYGATMGTWFNGGKKPIDVTCVTTSTPGLEVDEHSITVARYSDGMSKFETRWGTFTDPWVHQPQPACGYVIRGTHGTIRSDDYAEALTVQTLECPEGYSHPVSPLPTGLSNGIEYAIAKFNANEPIEGPLSPEVARIGQQIIETAIRSSVENRTVPLVEK